MLVRNTTESLSVVMDMAVSRMASLAMRAEAECGMVNMARVCLCFFCTSASVGVSCVVSGDADVAFRFVMSNLLLCVDGDGSVADGVYCRRHDLCLWFVDGCTDDKAKDGVTIDIEIETASARTAMTPLYSTLLRAIVFPIYI